MTETLKEAARRLSNPKLAQGYQPSALHTYTDIKGDAIYWRIRLKHPITGDKWIRPMKLNGRVYEMVEPKFDGPKPLYGLHQMAINPDATVWIVEGEQKVDALIGLGLVATTSGSATSASKTDWLPLQNRSAILWPDNDEPGKAYAEEVASILRGIGCRFELTDIGKLSLGVGEDVIDWLAAHPQATCLDVEALPRQTPTVADETNESPKDPWPNPDLGLLGADQMPAPVLGDDCLPPYVMVWCRTMAAALSAPVDYVVGNLLVSASGWMGNARRVRATPDWVEPPHLWIANVGGPSTSKTPAQRPFVEASGKLEGDHEDDWKRTLKNHERNTERAKARGDEWKKEIKDAAKMRVPAPDMPADAVLPDAPIRPRVLIADATVQEIGNILGGNPGGLLQVRDELSGWLGSMDQYSGAGSDRAFYLEAWNGGAYVIDRVKHGGQPVRVPYASLAITGGLQPDKLKEALTGADDGLAARFCYVWPETLPYSDLNNEHDATADTRRTLLLKAARRLHGLAWDTDDRCESIPHVLPLDAEGFKLLNEIRREAIAKSRAVHGLAAGWHGKTPGRVLRLALVIEHLNWSMLDEDSPPPEIVTGESVAYAGAYLDYLAAMFERVLAGLKIDATERDAAIVARLLVDEKPLKINEREIYQRAGFSFLRDKETRRSVFKALSDAGLVRPSTKTGKGRKAGDWDVNPAIWEAPREPMA